MSSLIGNKILLILGFRKAGTTSVYNLLQSTSAFNTSSYGKESQIYALSDLDFNREFDDFMRSYSSIKKWNMDSPTLSFYGKDWKKNLEKSKGASKAILIIRDPRYRAFSSYLHNKKRLKPVEKRSFSEIIGNVSPGSSFEEAFEIESNLLLKAFEENLIVPENINYEGLNKRYNCDFIAGFSSQFAQFDYISSSFYSKKIAEVLSALGTNNVLVESIENINYEPDQFVNNVSLFLDLPLELKTEVPRSNSSIVTPVYFKWLATLLRRTGLSRLKMARFVKRLIGHPTEKLTKAQYNTLTQVFKTEYTWLKENYPNQVKHWDWPEQ